MTLLAHWKLDEDRGIGTTTCLDSAGGGSGSHDGTYTMGSNEGGGALFPGGVGGSHLYSTYQGGVVRSIANPSDFNLHGSLTIEFWLHHWDEYTYWNGTARIMSSYFTPWATEADNYPWYIWTTNAQQGAPILSWQYGSSGTVVNVSCSVSPEPMWTHIAIKRYEITPGYYGVKFYYNGVLVDTQDNSGVGWPAPTGGANCIPAFGGRYDSFTSYYVHFFLDSVRIYDDEQSDEEILAVYGEEVLEMFPPLREEGMFSVREDAGFVGL